jgi:phosphotransferase system  glucose/maltose/N-acetylglucosamine-specific IIC component
MNVVGFFLRCYYAQNGRLFFNRFLQGLTMSLQYYVIFVFFEEFFDIAPKKASEEKL